MPRGERRPAGLILDVRTAACGVAGLIVMAPSSRRNVVHRPSCGAVVRARVRRAVWCAGEGDVVGPGCRHGSGHQFQLRIAVSFHSIVLSRLSDVSRVTGSRCASRSSFRRQVEWNGRRCVCGAFCHDVTRAAACRRRRAVLRTDETRPPLWVVR